MDQNIVGLELAKPVENTKTLIGAGDLRCVEKMLGLMWKISVHQ